MRNLIILVFIIIYFSSCSAINQMHKKELSDGAYVQIQDGYKRQVHIENLDDTIKLYSNNLPVDYINSQSYSDKLYLFKKSSFDIDFITIPVKYRPSSQGMPNQLSSDINASVYLGLRNDIFNIHFPKSISGKQKRKIQHFGYSIGGILGVGNTVINEHVTNNTVFREYQGIVLSKGVAGIIAINNYTIGLSYGFDHLLDKNRTNWIYQQKPWLGLTIGLNLN